MSVWPPKPHGFGYILGGPRCPPRGHRGYSRTVRAHDYGLRSPDDTPAPIIMAQIETAEGVSHAGEIARVDGIDALFVGPSDLQADLRHRATSASGAFAQ